MDIFKSISDLLLHFFPGYIYVSYNYNKLAKKNLEELDKIVRSIFWSNFFKIITDGIARKVYFNNNSLKYQMDKSITISYLIYFMMAYSFGLILTFIEWIKIIINRIAMKENINRKKVFKILLNSDVDMEKEKQEKISNYIKNELYKYITNNFFNRDEYTTVWSFLVNDINEENKWIRVYLKNSPIYYVGTIYRYTINPNDEIKEICLIDFKSYMLKHYTDIKDNYKIVDSNEKKYDSEFKNSKLLNNYLKESVIGKEYTDTKEYVYIPMENVDRIEVL